MQIAIQNPKTTNHLHAVPPLTKKPDIRTAAQLAGVYKTSLTKEFKGFTGDVNELVEYILGQIISIIEDEDSPVMILVHYMQHPLILSHCEMVWSKLLDLTENGEFLLTEEIRIALRKKLPPLKQEWATLMQVKHFELRAMRVRLWRLSDQAALTMYNELVRERLSSKKKGRKNLTDIEKLIRRRAAQAHDRSY